MSKLIHTLKMGKRVKIKRDTDNYKIIGREEIKQMARKLNKKNTKPQEKHILKENKMKEQLIKFETAKLAKEKGFDIKTIPFGYDNGGYLTTSKEIPAPTQSLLQKWLREEHFSHMYIVPYGDAYKNKDNKGSWNFSLIRDLTKSSGEQIEAFVKMKEERHNNNYNSYEEALEIGLQEALKLIK